MSASIALDCAAAAVKVKTQAVKPVDSVRRFRSTRPIDVICERIFRDWLRGVSERSLAIMYERTRETIEEICREQAQAIARAAVRAAARTAILLMALVGVEAWQAAAGVEAVPVARAFRQVRNTRRRGLEDGVSEAVEHARAQWRTAGVGGVAWLG